VPSPGRVTLAQQRRTGTTRTLGVRQTRTDRASGGPVSLPIVPAAPPPCRVSRTVRRHVPPALAPNQSFAHRALRSPGRSDIGGIGRSGHRARIRRFRESDHRRVDCIAAGREAVSVAIWAAAAAGSHRRVDGAACGDSQGVDRERGGRRRSRRRRLLPADPVGADTPTETDPPRWSATTETDPPRWSATTHTNEAGRRAVRPPSPVDRRCRTSSRPPPAGSASSPAVATLRSRTRR
jgi:hypothetical protein